MMRFAAVQKKGGKIRQDPVYETDFLGLAVRQRRRKVLRMLIWTRFTTVVLQRFAGGLAPFNSSVVPNPLWTLIYHRGAGEKRNGLDYEFRIYRLGSVY
jgi:hypothetical protein